MAQEKEQTKFNANTVVITDSPKSGVVFNSGNVGMGGQSTNTLADYYYCSDTKLITEK